MASFLPARDVLNLTQTCRELHGAYNSLTFWQLLIRAHFPAHNREFPDGQGARECYLLQSQLHNLSTVRWNRVDALQSNAPSGREGHLACRIGNYMILTGGFTDDNRIYYKHVDGNSPWRSIDPLGQTPTWVYGASLTTLDGTRALRFGGFQGGGYTHESSEVRSSSSI